MASDAAQTLNLVSQESSDSFNAFVRVLGELHYRVRLILPAMLTETGNGLPSLVYLGTKRWTPDAMRQLKSGAAGTSQLLTLERTAFRWAEPAIRNSRDFVSWPCPRSELKLRLERGCPTTVDNPGANETRRQDRSAPVRALGLVGGSPAFLDSLVTLRRFAECDAAVLIHGETGTGKELAARAIHHLSRRSSGPFVPVCCGALPDSLIEDEMFGHARGAFTDAHEARRGLISQAEAGTLFLDEVEALSAKGQAALLRFLESLEYRRVGGDRSRKADLRVIAAANEDLHALARRGGFRSDLLYRLNVLSLTLPPLRHRGGDAELLADHFLSLFSQRYNTGVLQLELSSRNWLTHHDWPGNVRELENVVHRAVVTSTGTAVTLTPETGQSVQSQITERPQEFGEAKRLAVEVFERDYLLALMRAAGGNVTQASRRAGKERRSLGKLLKKHGIDAAAFHDTAHGTGGQDLS